MCKKGKKKRKQAVQEVMTFIFKKENGIFEESVKGESVLPNTGTIA